MNKSPFSTMLLVAAAILVMAAVVLCGLYVHRNTDLRMAQMRLQQFNTRQQLVNALVNDTVIYSKTHPAVLPILESAGITNPPAASGK